MNARQATDFYRLVIEHSMDAVLLTAPAGDILAANPAACAMFRMTEDEICAAGRQGVVDRSSPGLASMLAERDRTGSTSGELTLIRGDGSRFPGEFTSAQFHDSEQQLRTAMIIRDISGRKHAESALLDSKALLDSIVNSTTDMIWSVDPVSFGLMWFNDAVRDYFQHRRGIDIARGMRPEDLFTDQEYIDLWLEFFRTARRNGSVTTEYEPSAGGSVLQLTLRAIERGGEVHAISVFGKDITEQKAAEHALIESEAKYRSVVMSMAEGVAIQAPDGRIIETNPAAAAIEGRNDQEMVGHDSDDPQWGAVRADGSPFPGDEHPAMVTLRTGEPQLNVVMGIRRPSGERRWISINSEPVYTTYTGKPDAVVTTFHDITDHKRAQDEITEYVQQLETSMQQTLRAVAAMVELRDPYTSGHMQRVGMIASDIAREMAWADDQCRCLEMAGMVHDIGKIAVPAELLTKPTHLTSVEYKIIQSHVDWSYEILKDIDFRLPIAEIVRQHHERLDGSGYPRGLRGDEIMPEARILAVADVVESIAADRPYRPARGVDEALREVLALRGIGFDADVVDAFQRMVDEQQYSLPTPESITAL